MKTWRRVVHAALAPALLSMLVAGCVVETEAEAIDGGEPADVAPDRRAPAARDLGSSALPAPDPLVITPEPVELDPSAIAPEPVELDPSAITPEPVELDPSAIAPEPGQ